MTDTETNEKKQLSKLKKIKGEKMILSTYRIFGSFSFLFPSFLVSLLLRVFLWFVPESLFSVNKFLYVTCGNPFVLGFFSLGVPLVS